MSVHVSFFVDGRRCFEHCCRRVEGQLDSDRGRGAAYLEPDLLLEVEAVLRLLAGRALDGNGNHEKAMKREGGRATSRLASKPDK